MQLRMSVPVSDSGHQSRTRLTRQAIRHSSHVSPYPNGHGRPLRLEGSWVLALHRKDGRRRLRTRAGRASAIWPARMAGWRNEHRKAARPTLAPWPITPMPEPSSGVGGGRCRRVVLSRSNNMAAAVKGRQHAQYKSYLVFGVKRKRRLGFRQPTRSRSPCRFR